MGSRARQAGRRGAASWPTDYIVLARPASLCLAAVPVARPAHPRADLRRKEQDGEKSKAQAPNLVHGIAKRGSRDGAPAVRVLLYAYPKGCRSCRPKRWIMTPWSTIPGAPRPRLVLTRSTRRRTRRLR